MRSDPMFILAMLSLNVAISEWLVRRTPLRHLGAALLVIVLTAVQANVGIIPTYSAEAPIYSGIFEFVAPLAIFWLLLQVHLKGHLHAGLPTVALFLIGSAGTTAGVIAGMTILGGEATFGAEHHALAGMFVGTYTGGSVNFNTIALHYEVAKDGMLYAGAAVVDGAMTTVWMLATVSLPRLLSPIWPRVRQGAERVGGSDENTPDDTEAVHPQDLGLTLALGAFVVWGAGALSPWIQEQTGRRIPDLLVVTTIALILAQVPWLQRLKGARVCGMFAVMLFLAVIGALCDLAALRQIGDLGTSLIYFVVIVVGVHGLIVFGAAAALRIDTRVAAVASQANIGGGTTALALARSLGRKDLVAPAILVGSLGTAIGTYLGFWVAGWLE